MNFAIVRNARVYHQGESKVDLEAVAFLDCRKGVKELCARWYSLGAIPVSPLKEMRMGVLEDYEATEISVRQGMSIKFFDLLHAVREGKAEISERQQDDEGYGSRTAQPTGG